jgi:hypothetical protein
MTGYNIPAEVSQFIFDKIDSVAQLEALLLCRANANTRWSVDAIAKRLYITEEQAANAAQGLLTEGLLKATETEPLQYHYEPRSHELANLVNQVAETYAKQLVPVTNLIHGKAKAKVQQFADAFRLRKDQ